MEFSLENDSLTDSRRAGRGGSRLEIQLFEKAEISIGYERVYTTTVSNSDVDDDAQKRRLAGKTVAILSFSP
mgnify:CR=1 FL=1